jgi:hypothetical protein
MSLDDICMEEGTPVCMELDINIDGMEVDEDSFMSGLCGMMCNISLKDCIYDDESDDIIDDSIDDCDADGMEVDEDSFMDGLCDAMSVLLLNDNDCDDKNDDRIDDSDSDGMEVDEDSFMDGLCDAMSVLFLKDDDCDDKNVDRIDDDNVDGLKVNLYDHSIQASPRIPILPSKSVQDFLSVAASCYVFRDMSSDLCGKTHMSPTLTEVRMR